MAKLKLNVSDHYESDFQLFAIHSSLKDFRLAFLLNKNLEVLFEKKSKMIEISSKTSVSSYSFFEFYNTNHDTEWHLIKNNSVLVKESNPSVFFETENLGLALVPELKFANYLLKINTIQNGVYNKSIVQTIKTIKEVSTCYEVPISQLKSINNLIY